MNSFYEHHQDSIRFGYRCFDRILLNASVDTQNRPLIDTAKPPLTDGGRDVDEGDGPRVLRRDEQRLG